MLQTIEVEIDYNGVVHPIETTAKLPAGRALLTLLEPVVDESEELKQLLTLSLNKLYKQDLNFISRGVHEQAITFRFGIYLNELIKNSIKFHSLNVDAEYDKNGENKKKIPSRANNGVRPDIILHKRESNDKNKLIVEFKKSRPNRNEYDDDFEKLKDFTNQSGDYKYKLGAFVLLGVEKPEIKYFVNGEACND